MSTLQDLNTAITKGKKNDAEELTRQAIESGLGAADVLDALTTAMAGIGERFKKNEIYVPEVLIAARAMNAAMAILEPVLVADGLQPKHTVVIGTVKGDLHDIGKNLVGMMLKGANFKVVDLGVNVDSAKFVAAAREHNADIIALSALLTTTMSAMKDTVEAVKLAGLTQTKVMIGGAPVTQNYADEIGADGYSTDAGSAVELAKTLSAA
jgi:5-methyltetrahydrofolate--homocysteine methyltransferase